MVGNGLQQQVANSITCVHVRPPLNHPYHYLPLPYDGSSMRTLELLPAQFSDPVHISLSITDTRTSRGSYIALSYAWDNGPRIVYEHLFVNGEELLITPGLMHILKVLRNPFKARKFWIDQICINQQDSSERSQQMTIMREIYSSAKRTLVWLGDSGNDDEEFMSLIEACTEYEAYLRQLTASTLLTLGSGANLNFAAVFTMHAKDEISGFHIPAALRNITQVQVQQALKFFERRWFQRLWPVQEVIVSKQHLRGRCGVYEFEWANLTLLGHYLLHQERINSMLTYRHASTGLQAMNWVYWYWSQEKSSFPLVEMLRATRRFQASEDCDKVFAILGLTEEVQAAGLHIPEHLTIDNTASKTTVYLRIACYLLHRTQDLMCLSFVQHTATSIQSAAMPSWVPDWTQTELVTPLWLPTPLTEMLFNAGPSSKLPYPLNISPILTVVGFKIANVLSENIAGPFLPEDVKAMALRQPNGHWKLVLAILRMCSHLVQTVTNSDALFGTIALTLTAGRNSNSMLVTKEKYRWIFLDPAVVHHARAFCFYVASLEFSMPGEVEVAFEDLREVMIEYSNGTRSENIETALFNACRNRTLFSINDGKDWCLGPLATRQGDIMFVLEGSRVPILLRPRESQTGYYMVGECYMCSAMNGDYCDDWDQRDTEVLNLH